MKALRCVIVDDEQPAREQILHYLKDNNRVDVMDVCKDGFEAIKSIQKYKPDLVFLDIQMPRLTGFEMLELLDDPPVVIFSTAYDEYALKAFDVHAVDYLLKPYTRKRFQEALDLAAEKIQSKAAHKDLKAIENAYQENAGPVNRIVVKQSGKIIILPLKDIRYLEAMDDYVAVHTTGHRYLKQKPMKFFEKTLNPKQFVRVHRSYLVNIECITTIEPYGKETWKLVLNDGEHVSVSRTGMKKLNELMDFGA